MIRRFKNVSARTKILLFAFLFIILPSGILGYLGFRSIGSRGLGLKENYRSMARLERDEIEAELSNLEVHFVREIFDQEWEQDIQTDQRLLEQARKRHTVIGEAFIIDPDGSLIHPQFLLEMGNSRRTEVAGIYPSRNRFIEQGERYEFSEFDYPEAARSYTEAVRLAGSPELRMYPRLLLGRCYFKMKDYIKAGEQYRILAEQGRNTRASDGTPLKIIGLFRLAETYASLGEDDLEVHSLLDLFEELSLGSGAFESRDFYLETVRTNLDRIFQERAPGKSEKDRWERLQLDDEVRVENIRRLERIRQFLLSQLNSNASPNSQPNSGPGSDLPSSSRLTIRDEEGTPQRVGYLMLPSKRAAAEKRILVYEFDKPFVLTELFPRLAAREGVGDGVRAALYGAAGPLVPLPDAPQPSQALALENLSEHFPGWNLALFDSHGKSIDQIVLREMRLYGGVLFGIAILILSGIVMTLRAATHEAETVRLRSDFVSNISHELKTPLSLIRLFGETLESEGLTDDAKRREFSRIIARESRRLTHLIDNVLDFSKIDSGRKEYAFERGDLVEVLSDTLDAYRLYLRDQGFKLDISLPTGPIFMSMDKDALAQALLNLLNNAEKYSGERKYIGIKVIIHGEHASITVEDKGPGIPPSDLKHIFEKFYRGGTRPAQEAQGCGLGLTIVKNTVESHGGGIRVESEPGRGSRFIITLPLRDQEEQSRGSSEEDHGQNPDR